MKPNRSKIAGWLASSFTCALLWVLPALGTDYYVDNSLTGSLNTGTSWANAWTNFSSVRWYWNFQVAPSVGDGDTLYFSGGTTSQVYGMDPYDRFVIVGGTDTNNLLTITVGVEAGHNGKVIFDGNSDVMQATNTSWNGNGMAMNGGFIFDGGANSNFVFRNWYNTNNYANANAIGQSVVNHARLTRFVITNCGDGIQINSAADTEISYFETVRIKGDHCIQVGSGGTNYGDVRIHHGLIRGNTTLSQGHGPDGIQSGDGTDVHDCVFWSDPNGDIIENQHPDALQIAGNFIRIYNNTFHNWGGAGNSSDPLGPVIHDIVFANNVYVYDHTNFVVCTIFGSGYVENIAVVSNFYLLGNTFVDFHTRDPAVGGGSGIGFEWEKAGGADGQNSHPRVTNFWFANNIFHQVGNSDANGAVAVLGSYQNTNWDYRSITLSNNLTSWSNTLGSVQFGSGGDVSHASYFVWQQSALLTNQPAFSSYARYSTNSDFHLSPSDTAAQSQGVNLTALYTALGIPRTTLDGVARAASGAWDIGAYGTNGVAAPSNDAVATAARVTVRNGVTMRNGVIIR